MLDGQWVEIPAHRVWVVDGMTVRVGYELLNEDGQPCREMERFVVARRKSDGKLFRALTAFGGLVYTMASGTDHLVFTEA